MIEIGCETKIAINIAINIAKSIEHFDRESNIGRFI
jgi:hypothetical protein